MQDKITSVSHLVEKVIGKLNLLDFTMLKTKLQDTEEGKGWSSERCDLTEADDFVATSAKV